MTITYPVGSFSHGITIRGTTNGTPNVLDIQYQDGFIDRIRLGQRKFDHIVTFEQPINDSTEHSAWISFRDSCISDKFSITWYDTDLSGSTTGTFYFTGYQVNWVNGRMFIQFTGQETI